MSDNQLQTAEQASDNQIAKQSPQDGDIVSAAEGKADVKELGVIPDDDPRAQALGGSGSRALQVDPEWIKEIFTDQIYGDNAVFFREFLQNSETACITAARYLLRNHPEYGDDWLTLTRWINTRTGETVLKEEDKQAPLAQYTDDEKNVRPIEVPRPLHEVVEAARSIGYDPTIRIDVHHDENKVVFEDNGIGMTLDIIDGAYNFLGRSGSAVDGDTGGKWGAGARTFAILTGMEGGMVMETRTRRDASAPNVEEYDLEGHRAYVYPGGYDLLPGEPADDFRGTRFTIPVQESVNMHDFKEALDTYGAKLRVPVLYHEQQNGQTTVKEEYGGTPFIESFEGKVPVVIDRPGEFTAIAGPDIGGYKEPDTWLVSMEIERNTSTKVKSFWNVALQVHDEQGLIVSGPNRGKRRTEVDLHPDDVCLPEPTVDRDRFQKDEHSRKFFEWLGGEMRKAELETVGDLMVAMREADHPAYAVAEHPEQWDVFKKMVKHHSYRSHLRSASNFRDFITELEGVPDYDKDTAEAVYELFQKVDFAGRHASSPELKSTRSEERLGDVFASCNPDHIFMAASTGGNFVSQYRVVYKTYPDGGVIVLKGAHQYEKYERKFGFRRLKNVPLKRRDDHDFRVPEDVHKTQVRKAQRKQEAKEEAEEELNPGDITLKFRTNDRNQSIDTRMSMQDVKDRLSNGRTIGGHRYVIGFRRGGESITDHYSMQRYGAIVSVTNDEHEMLKEHPRYFTYEEFHDFSKATVYATEEGAKTAEELFEDERFVALFHEQGRDLKELLKDEGYAKRLRRLYADDIRDAKLSFVDDKPDSLFAVADSRALERGAYGINLARMEVEDFDKRNRVVLARKGTRRWSGYLSINQQSIRGDARKMKRQAATPKWDNESQSYDQMGRQEGNRLEAIFYGFHDAGVDPYELESDEVGQLVASMDTGVIE